MYYLTIQNLRSEVLTAIQIHIVDFLVTTQFSMVGEYQRSSRLLSTF
jgi:hypothetical protein